MLNLQDKPPRYNVTEAKFAQNKEHFMKHRDKLSWTFPQVAIVVLLLFCTISTAPAQTTLPAEDIAEKALAATVYLEMKDKNGKTLGIGSGFFVKSNLIATNYHVIEGAAKGTAKLVGKYTTYNIEGVTATDKTNDLALLKVIAYGIKPLSLGDSDAVRIGATVYVAGNPKGLEGTFSDGIISSRRDKDTKERLQMTAPISPGSSGGPVINRKGEVIGISFAGHQALDAQNLNFAIPSKYLKALLEQSKPAKPLSQGKHSISAETYILWGNAKYKLEDYIGAITNYTMAIRLKPDEATAYNNRGVAKNGLGQHFAAIADFDIAIRLKPNEATVYNNRGHAKDELGQYFAAISDYDIAIRLKPDSAETYYNRGCVKGDLGQHFAAISDYDIAIRFKPDFAEAYNNRGLAKGELGQYSAAISDYDIAIRLKPDSAETYRNRGVAKGELEQHFAAISDYDIAIRFKPDSAETYNSRGIAKNNLEQHSAAISDYDIAIRFKPNFTEAYNNRGLVKYGSGQYFAAISDFDIAIRLKPDYVEAYTIRGFAKYKLGRTWEAKQDLRTALKLAEKSGDTVLKTDIESILQKID